MISSVSIYELNEESHAGKISQESYKEDLPPEPLNYREDGLEFLKFWPVLYEIFGTDITQLCGIGASVAMTFLSTVGTDVKAWPTAGHFTSWLALAPMNQVSAGSRKSSKTARSANPLRRALVNTAMIVQRTDSYLGENHRRLKAASDQLLQKSP
ncbi:MAG: transposase [Christensenellales bacterium]